MRDYENWELQNEIKESLKPEEQIEAQVILNKTLQRWKTKRR